MLEHSDAAFPSTRWSLIDAIVKGDDAQRQTASSILANTYWPAIYAFLRKSGTSGEDAAELAQAFFTHVILRRKLFERADPSTGPLRTLILHALKNYATDCQRREGAARTNIPIEPRDLKYEEGLLDHKPFDPDAYFMKRWALAVLQEALRRCEEHYRSAGKASHWLMFEARVIRPSLAMQPPPSHEQIAKSLNLGGPSASIMAVRVVQKRLMALIRQVLAESNHDVKAQEAEFNEVVALLT